MADGGWWDEWGSFHPYNPPDMGNSAPHTPMHHNRPERPAAAVPAPRRAHLRVVPEPEAETLAADVLPTFLAPPPEPDPMPKPDVATGLRLYARQIRELIDRGTR